MLVCVDTNVMLSAAARNSPLAPLLRAIMNGQVRLALSVPILLEYEEIAAERGCVCLQDHALAESYLAAPRR